MKKRILLFLILVVVATGCVSNYKSQSVTLTNDDYDLSYDIYVEDSLFLVLDFSLVYNGEENEVEVFPSRSDGENPFIYYISIEGKDYEYLKALVFTVPHNTSNSMILKKGEEHTFTQKISITDIKDNIEYVDVGIHFEVDDILIIFEEKTEFRYRT